MGAGKSFTTAAEDVLMPDELARMVSTRGEAAARVRRRETAESLDCWTRARVRLAWLALDPRCLGRAALAHADVRATRAARQTADMSKW